MFLEEKREGEPALADWQQHLLRAADLLERDGWCQHTIRNAKGEYCLIGAMSAVGCLDGSTFTETRLAINKYLGKHYPGYGNRIEWNNAPGRTKEEVVACLRGAVSE